VLQCIKVVSSNPAEGEQKNKLSAQKSSCVIFTLHKHYTFLYMNDITFEVHLHVFPTQLKYVIMTASEISYEKEVILKTN
jgi:hypothetical protein